MILVDTGPLVAAANRRDKPSFRSDRDPVIADAK